MALRPLLLTDVWAETIRPLLFRSPPESDEDFATLLAVRSASRPLAAGLQQFVPPRSYSPDEIEFFRGIVFGHNIGDDVRV